MLRGRPRRTERAAARGGLLAGMVVLGGAVIGALAAYGIVCTGHPPHGPAIVPPADGRGVSGTGGRDPAAIGPARPATPEQPGQAATSIASGVGFPDGWYRRGEKPARLPADGHITDSQLDDYLWTWLHDPNPLHRGEVLSSLMIAAPADPRVVRIYRGILEAPPDAPNRQVAFTGLVRARASGVRDPDVRGVIVNALLVEPDAERRAGFVDTLMFQFPPIPEFADMQDAMLEIFWRGPPAVRLRLASAIADGTMWEPTLTMWPGARENCLSLLEAARARESAEDIRQVLDSAIARTTALPPVSREPKK